MTQVLKKLSAAVLGDPMDAVRQGGRVYIGRISGIAGGLKAYTTPNGDPANGLKGAFKGVNAAGEVFRAPICYLPGAANAFVEGALMSGSSAVEFAFDVYSVDVSKRAGKKSATGYEYETVSLIEPSAEHDPLERLDSMLPPPAPGGALALEDQSDGGPKSKRAR